MSEKLMLVDHTGRRHLFQIDNGMLGMRGAIRTPLSSQRIKPSSAKRTTTMWGRPSCIVSSTRAYSVATATEAASRVVLQSLCGIERIGGRAAISPALPERVLVVTEREPCPVAVALAAGYRAAFPDAQFLTFDPSQFFEDLAQAALPPQAVVVLLQNGAFQNELKTYRLRMRLWDLGFKVAEHGHLDTITPGRPFESADQEAAWRATFGSDDAIIQRYLEACALCPFECEREARIVANRIDACGDDGLVVESRGGHSLVYGGRLDRCLINSGSYYESGSDIEGSANSSNNPMKTAAAPPPGATRSVGGSYPFGEVITESTMLSDVNGTASIFAFPNLRRSLTRLPLDRPPFAVTVEKGAIVDVEQTAPAEFKETVALVREVEGVALLRELGIGMNKFLSKQRPVADITAFERQFGVHFSLGKRHPLFVKAPRPPGDALPSGRMPYDFLRRRDGKFHLDVFIDATRVRDRHGATIVDFFAGGW